MSIDVLQKTIRNKKSPIMVDFQLSPKDIPLDILKQNASVDEALIQYLKDLLNALNENISAVRFRISTFLTFGLNGIAVLTQVLSHAHKLGLYIFLDSPEMLSPPAAESLCGALQNSFYFDALILCPYIGSDIVKSFLPLLSEEKCVFITLKTPNRSGQELQDLITGSRNLYLAAADLMNRCAGEYIGECGYSNLGLLSSAVSAQSLSTLRYKYPKMFIIADGADFTGSNFKNSSNAFDKFGYGGMISVGNSVITAWRESDENYTDAAVSEILRIKKNIRRYITIL